MVAALLTGSTAVVTPAWGQVVGEDLKMVASDGAFGDWFGWSIDLDDGVVAVAASRNDDNGSNSGSAYLFDASTGAEIDKLLPSDGEFDDQFGWSIAIDNGLVAVGSPLDGDNGFRSGAAYLFDASTGAQLAKLLSSDGEAEDKFGYCIALDNGVVAVGAPYDIGGDPGSAYLFDASTGAEIAILLPDDNPEGGQFGISIAIDDGIVAVGAYLDNENGAHAGSAYLFDASTGTQFAKLLPSDGVAGDYFGWSIAIDNGVVAVGAFQDDDNGSDSGSGYLFDAATGTQLAKLLPSDGAVNDYFGVSITIDSGIVAVGARGNDDNGSGSGSAYLFDASTGLQIAKLLPSDGLAFDLFGQSVAINNGIVAVGAMHGDNGGGTDFGAAYVFEVGCPADLDGDGLVNTQDFLGFLNAWANGTPYADWNIDGTIDSQDFLAYLNDWVAGCP